MALTVDYKEGVLKDIRGNPTMRTFGKIAASISAFLGFQTPMAVFS